MLCRSAFYLAVTAVMAAHQFSTAEEPTSATHVSPVLTVTSAKGADRSVRLEEKLSSSMPLSRRLGPARELLHAYAESLGVPLIVDEMALSDEGISLDDVVDIQTDVSQLSVREVIELVIEPLNLSLVNHNGILKITTESSAEELMIVKIYDVSDLIVSSTAGQTPQPSDLLELIYDMTEGPWFVVDGVGGSASFLGTRLVVRQNDKVHGEIDRLLRTLRLSFGKPQPAESMEQAPATTLPW